MISSINNISFGARVRIGKNDKDKLAISERIANLPEDRRNMIIKNLNETASALANGISDEHSLYITYESNMDLKSKSHGFTIVDMANPNRIETAILFDGFITDNYVKQFFKDLQEDWIKRFDKAPATPKTTVEVFNQLI